MVRIRKNSVKLLGVSPPSYYFIPPKPQGSEVFTGEEPAATCLNNRSKWDEGFSSPLLSNCFNDPQEIKLEEQNLLKENLKEGIFTSEVAGICEENCDDKEQIRTKKKKNVNCRRLSPTLLTHHFLRHCGKLQRQSDNHPNSINVDECSIHGHPSKMNKRKRSRTEFRKTKTFRRAAENQQTQKIPTGFKADDKEKQVVDELHDLDEQKRSAGAEGDQAAAGITSSGSISRLVLGDNFKGQQPVVECSNDFQSYQAEAASVGNKWRSSTRICNKLPVDHDQLSDKAENEVEGSTTTVRICSKTDGKKWRCKELALDDHPFCQTHLDNSRCYNTKFRNKKKKYEFSTDHHDRKVVADSVQQPVNSNERNKREVRKNVST